MSVQSASWTTFVHVRELCRGAVDAIMGITVIGSLGKEDGNLPEVLYEGFRSVLARKRERQRVPVRQQPEKKTSVMNRVFQCCLLNGVVVVSSFLIFQMLMSLLGMFFSASPHWKYLSVFLDGTFKVFWAFPLLLLSTILNSYWFRDIADAMSKKENSRIKNKSFPEKLSDYLFTFIIQIIFLIQAFIVSFLWQPYGNALNIIHNALINSFYTFETKWSDRGIRVDKRISKLEDNWPYYVGFGMPLALIHWVAGVFFNRLIACGLYSMLFPLFIIATFKLKEEKNDEYLKRIAFFKPASFVASTICQFSLRRARRVKTQETQK